jgi:hypothetical protein
MFGWGVGGGAGLFGWCLFLFFFFLFPFFLFFFHIDEHRALAARPCWVLLCGSTKEEREKRVSKTTITTDDGGFPFFFTLINCTLFM